MAYGSYTYRKKRRPRKRRYYKKRKRMTRYNPVPRKSLLGNSRCVRLRYNTGLQLVPDIIGGPVAHIFSSNGLFDPDITGTGHQPRGFDQIQPLYSHHTVIYSKCSAWFTPTNDIAGTPDGNTQMIGVSLQAGLAAKTTSADYLEDRNVNYKCIGNFRNGPPVKCVAQFTPKNFLNISKPMSANELKGNASALPEEGAFFHVFASPIIFATTENGNLQVNVTIDYVTVFTEPVLPGES